MPSRGPRLCICGTVVVPGSVCPCRAASQREYDRRRPTSRQRGYNSRWDRERLEHLRLYPLCKFCGKPANVVDHVIPHKGDKDRFWNRSNWQSLCTTCHNRWKQVIERRQIRTCA